MPEIFSVITHITWIIFLYFQMKICYHLFMKDKEIMARQSMTSSEEQPLLNINAPSTITLEQAHAELNTKYSVLEIQYEAALQKIHWFEEQLKLSRSRQFNKSSEKLSGLQSELIFNADEGLTESTPATDVQETTETSCYTRRKKKNGRNIDTSKLPRRQEIHDLAPAQKMCCDCGSELHKVRDEVTEQIEIIPKQLYVVEHIHPQYACRHCVTMTAAEKAVAPIPKSMAGASLITEIIISKYEHHLPLYRQSQIFCGLGSAIPDNTLGNWVMQAGEGLLKLEEALQQEIIQTSYLQVDETPVKLLAPEKQAYMWVFYSPLAPNKLIRFRFDVSRSGKIADEELKNFQGLLQNDAYSGYNGAREQPGIIPLGCLAHARRRFTEVVKISALKSQGKAQEALTYFAKLYQLEEQARQATLDFAARKRRRQLEAIPILNQFKQWLLTTQQQVPPESAIGKAIDYTLKQWPYLIRYVDYGEAEIDNNWIENQIRPFALGKKNWLFLKHEDSAKIAALFYSLIQSAKLNALNPRIYVHYLLTQIHSLRRKQVNPVDLLPHRMNREILERFAADEYQKARLILAPTCA